MMVKYIQKINILFKCYEKKKISIEYMSLLGIKRKK